MYRCNFNNTHRPLLNKLNFSRLHFHNNYILNPYSLQHTYFSIGNRRGKKRRIKKKNLEEGNVKKRLNDVQRLRTFSFFFIYFVFLFRGLLLKYLYRTYLKNTKLVN